MCNQTKQVADQTSVTAARCLTAHNKDKRSHSPHENAQYLFIRNRFFQINGCHNHGNYRQSSRYDGSVDRRSHGKPEDKYPLIENQSKEGSKENLQHITVVHVLLFAEDGKYPECRCRAYHTKRGDGDSGKLLKCRFADRRHQSPHDICRERKEMPMQILIITHKFVYTF